MGYTPTVAMVIVVTGSCCHGSRLDNVWIVLVVLMLEMGGWRATFVGTWGVGNIDVRFIEIHIAILLVLR